MARERPTTDAGFTLTEMLVVVVIVGVLAGLALPSLSRDRQAFEAREFANEVARELQRARMEATTSRMPMYAFIYSNRIEIRSATPGATPAADLIAPTTASPIHRTIRARDGVVAFDVLSPAVAPSDPAPPTTPSAPVLTISTPKIIAYSSLGAGFIPDCTGYPPTPCQPGTPPTMVSIYVRHQVLPFGHPERRYRIDISGVSGFTNLRSSW